MDDETAPRGWTGWRSAAERALYGPAGFFRRPGAGPAGHFRTSVHASPLFAAALAGLARRVDDALGHPDPFEIVDVGAGRGELAVALLDAADPVLAGRLRVRAVERADRPAALDPRVAWAGELPRAVTGLLIANEWLDNVPVDVAEVAADGTARYVLVGPRGEERLGGPVGGADADWLARWWPLSEPGARAEIGLPRDEAWARAVGSLCRGLAVAVDYAHERAARPPWGTLAAYREGRQVPPVPDGSCDLTAHVALDACAAAAANAANAAATADTTDATVDDTLLTSQRSALRALGVRAERPPLALASSDPAGYVRALANAGEAGELTERGGLGSFTWLLQGVGIRVPLDVAALGDRSRQRPGQP